MKPIRTTEKMVAPSGNSVSAMAPLQIEQVPIDQLDPDPANPRRISESELEALTRSIQRFGFVDPVIARREDGLVIGGHQRLVAARKLGYITVPVVFVDLSLEQARTLNLALNKISGEWDQELLARLLADLASASADLSLTGFADDEVKKLLRSLDHREKRDRPEAFDLDAALEAAQGQHGAKRGDIFALGEHRLLCGDATDGADVTRLLAGMRAAMCVTDPPYNVALGDHGGQQQGTRRRRIQNDALPPEQWEAFCRGWARTSSTTWTARSTSACRPRNGRSSRVAGRSRRPLVGHDHLGEGPLRPGPRRLPAAVRADLVRLARRREAPLVRRPRPGRRLGDRAAVRLAAAPDDEAARAGRARDQQQQQAGRRRARSLPRIGDDADRRRAHRPRLLRHGTRPALRLGCHREDGKCSRERRPGSWPNEAHTLEEYRRLGRENDESQPGSPNSLDFVRLQSDVSTYQISEGGESKTKTGGRSPRG